MRGVVMYAPGDVRVEDRPEPTIREADRCDHPAVRDLYLRVGSVALPRDRGADRPRPMGHEYAGIVEEVGSAVTTVEAGPVRRRVVLRLRQHLRDLPVRLPVVLPAPRGVRPDRCRAGRADAGAAGRRHPGRHPGGSRRGSGAAPAGRLRRARHRLVRRRRRRGRPGQDGRRGRRRRGRAARCAGRASSSAPNGSSR